MLPQLIQVTQIIHQATKHCLTCKNINSEETEDGSEVVLSANNGSSNHNQHWLLDYRLDGTFLIISNSKNRLVVTCEHDTTSPANIKLIMSRFNGKDSQLWRFDGRYIESVSFEGHVISCTSVSGPDLILCAKDPTSIKQLFIHKVSLLHYMKYKWSGLFCA